MRGLILVVLFCSIFLPAFFVVNAQTSSSDNTVLSIDLTNTDLDEETVAKIIAAQKKAKQEAVVVRTQNAFERAKDFARFGESIAEAIAAVCNTLSVEVNDFIKTPVGKITMFMIVWKVVGADILGIIGGSLILLVLGTVIIASFRHFHMKTRVLVSEEIKEGKKIKKYEHETYDFDSDSARYTSASFHVGLFCVLVITCMSIIF